MHYYDMSYEDVLKNFNIIKDDIFDKLEADGIIPNAEELSSQYVILPVKIGLFGRIFNSFFGADDKLSAMKIKIVKVS